MAGQQNRRLQLTPQIFLVSMAAMTGASYFLPLPIPLKDNYLPVNQDGLDQIDQTQFLQELIGSQSQQTPQQIELLVATYYFHL